MSDLEGYTHLKNVPYSDVSRLNTLDVWIPKQNNGDQVEGKGLWVIYIHGGAWRDPLITPTSLIPTLSHLTHLPLSGISSLSYRLSPYPTHPTSPSTPTDASRNATHPTHLNDILTALTNLQHHYPITNYILIGHSCGATLAFQAARVVEQTPAVVVGVEGIYDIPALVRQNPHPAYREFITAAFGVQEQVWRSASPVGLEIGVGKVVLAHSKGDELVGWDQVQGMEMALRDWGYGDGKGKEIRMLELQGGHDEVWEDGRELARTVEIAVRWVLDGGD